MTSLGLVGACFVLGVLLQGLRRLRPLTPRLNTYVISIAVPSLVLDVVPKLELDPALFVLAAVPWVAFGVSAIVWQVAARLSSIDRRTVGGMTLVTGLGNTAFLGYPVVSAIHGTAGLELAVIVDQPGTFLAFATLGVLVAQTASGTGRPNLGEVFRRVMTFPPFVALLAAVIMGAMDRSLPTALAGPVAMLGRSVAPVAMLALGLQLRLRYADLFDRWAWLALATKMLAVPALAHGVFRGFDLTALQTSIGTLQMSMPPMVTAGLLAAQYDLDGERALRAVALGLPLSAATVAGLLVFG